jgi:hypothetical protein
MSFILNPYYFAPAAEPPGGPAEWTPADITTALWLDAADASSVTEVSGAVSAMADKSGNGRDVSQATSSFRPAVLPAELNSLPVHRYDGVSDRLESSLAADIFRNKTYGWSTAVVKRVRDSAVLSDTIVGVTRGTTNNGLRFSTLAAVNGFGANQPVVGGRRLDGDSFAGVTHSTAKTGEWYLLFGALDWGNNAAEISIDGGAIETATGVWAGAGATSDTDSLGKLGIGCSFAAGLNNPADYGQIDLAEVICGDTVLDTPTRQRIEGYLAHKWGLEGNLPPGHPYKNSPPTKQWTIADATTALWLDAADATTITTSGADVTTWADKSGNANEAGQATSTRQPQLSTLDGKDVVSFNSDRMELSSTVTTVRAAFFVTNNAAGSEYVPSIPVNEPLICPVIGGPTTVDSHTFIRTGDDAYDISIDGSIAATGSAASDGGAAVSGTDIETGLSTAEKSAARLWYAEWDAAQDVFYIGGIVTASNQLYGRLDIAEVILLDSVPSTVTRQRTEGYLAHKWGLEASLPVDHPYKDTAPTVDGDPHWPNVSLLLSMEGTDASTTFADSSPNEFALTTVGGAQIDTAQAKFGDASGLFDGNGDYLTSPSDEAFSFGAGEFTVEGWFRPTAANSNAFLLDFRVAAGDSFMVWCSQSANSNKLCYSNQVGTGFLPGSTAFTLNAWNHWAVVRDGTTIRGYLNGVQVFSGTDSRTFASPQGVYIGSSTTASQGAIGHIDEVRITKGVCRYPGGTTFTPPTEPFPRA